MSMTKVSFAVVTLGFLAACGGGGGGANASPESPASQVSVSQANYETVAQASFDAAQGVTGLSNDATAQFLTGAVVGQQPAWLGVAVQQIRRIGNGSLTQGRWAVGADVSYSSSCGSSGRTDLTLIDSNNNEVFDAGDKASIAFVQCNESGVYMNGTLRLSINSGALDSDASVMNVDFNATYESFTATASGFSAHADGDIHMKLSGTSDNQLLDVSASNLKLGYTSGGVTRQNQMTDVKATINSVWNASRRDYLVTESVSGWFVLAALDNQSAYVETPSVLTRWGLQAYPHQGQMTFTGKSGSKARLTAVDALQVKLELDSNGDGVYEGSKTKNWSLL